MFNLGKKYGAFIKTRHRVYNVLNGEKIGHRPYNNNEPIQSKVFYCTRPNLSVSLFVYLSFVVLGT
jgi:hypothetical protein